VKILVVAIAGSSLPRRAPAAASLLGLYRLNSFLIGQVFYSDQAEQIADEVVKLLTGLVGAKVEMVLEVRAEVPDGVPENIERAVSENARQLKFQTFEFEED
jgi:RecA/RadA recombinase